MRIDRFYIQISLAVDDELTLPKPLSHRLTRVLRMKAGQKITLFNGQGGEYAAEIIHTDNRVIVKITQYHPVSRESSLITHLAQALPKVDKMDWVVQKATELGVSKITPVLTEFCEVKMDAKRTEKKWQHWQNISISAAEQCGRTAIPEIDMPINFTQWITTVNSSLKLLCHPGEQTSTEIKKPQDVCIAIGPEGGFSDREVGLASQNQFETISLGPRLLRTETASTVILTLCQQQWGDLPKLVG